jgi:hypothetical protein
MPNGGVIGKSNATSLLSASGVWGGDEQYLAQLDSKWPIFVPQVVLNADVWLDAADTSTITESGGAVSQWNNKGSLGNFTQATAAQQPTTGVSTLNGLNVIDFAADRMNSADTAATYKFLHDGTDYIVASVLKAGVVANPNTVYLLFGTNGGTGGTIGVQAFYDDRSSISRNDRFYHSVQGASGTLVINNASSDGFLPANIFNVITIFSDPNNGTAANRSAMYKDAGSAVKNNTSTGSVSSSDPSYVLQLGDSGLSNAPWTGSIAELIIVSGADATEANREIIRDYLNLKWAVY